MNNQSAQTQKENNAHLERVFSEMRQDKSDEKEAKPAVAGKKFETLPDGVYTGRVYVEINTVASEKSPNYGRSKYEIKLNVVDGEYKGKMAFNHRVIMPHNLADAPNPALSAEAAVAFEKWRTDTRDYLEQTDRILSNCGVDISDKDMARFTLRIAENNRRNPIVNFSMRNGVPYINGLLQGTNTDSDELFKDQTLPDGNDAPID